MLKINVDSANVTCPTASLSRHMLSTKLFTMYFATVGFRKFMGRVKINLFDVLDKYEYWKGKCVKSVLGEFSSGVSML